MNNKIIQNTTKTAELSPKTAQIEQIFCSKSEKRPTKTPKIRRQDVFYAIFLAAWTILALFASQFLTGFLAVLVAGEKAKSPFVTLVMYFISYAMSLGILIFVTPKLITKTCRRASKTLHKSEKPPTSPEEEFATTPSELGLGNWPTFIDIGLAPVAYIVYLLGAAALNALMKVIPWIDAEQAQNVGFDHYLAGSDRLFAILAIVFLAPIAEELIMRGWLYGKLRNRLGIIISILVTSLVFGIAHGQVNVALTVGYLSLILCGLREITGTIWCGMLLHMLVNGIAFYVLYIAGV